MSTRRRWIIGIVTLVLTSLSGGVAIFDFTEVRALRERGETVPAVVVETETGKYPRMAIRYPVRTGGTFSKWTSNVDKAKVGQTVNVTYDRENPRRARVVDNATSYDAVYILGTMAILGLLIGTFLIRRWTIHGKPTQP